MPPRDAAVVDPGDDAIFIDGEDVQVLGACGVAEDVGVISTGRKDETRENIAARNDTNHRVQTRLCSTK